MVGEDRQVSDRMATAAGTREISTRTPSANEGESRQLASFLTWLAVGPIVLTLLLAIGQAGMTSAQVPNSADTLSRMHADYSPWEMYVIRPVNPAILEVISRDLANDSGGDGRVPGMSQGGFWTTAQPTFPVVTSSSTPTPTQTIPAPQSQTPTANQPPVQATTNTPTSTSTPILPTRTPTRTNTPIPSTFTPTPTRTAITPTRTSTPTRTPSRTATPSGKKCSSPPVVTILDPKSDATYTTFLPARVVAYDPDNSDPVNCTAPGSDGEGISRVIFRWEYWPDMSDSVFKDQIDVFSSPFCPFGQGTPCDSMDLAQGWWPSGFEPVENGLHSLYLYVGDDEDEWTETEVWFTIQVP